jgi:vacuolar-type H+-ATPase subunit E/Vma4
MLNRAKQRELKRRQKRLSQKEERVKAFVKRLEDKFKKSHQKLA